MTAFKFDSRAHIYDLGSTTSKVSLKRFLLQFREAFYSDVMVYLMAGSNDNDDNNKR